MDEGKNSKGDDMMNNDILSDEQIIEMYFDRDEQAISETDVKYGKYLFSIAQNILKNANDSEECRNDTYLNAWNSIPPTRPPFLYSFACSAKSFISLKGFCASVPLLRYNNATKIDMKTVHTALKANFCPTRPFSISVFSLNEPKNINNGIAHTA